MSGFFNRINQFIKGIQRSDDRRKKRWLVIFSGIGMIFIVALWVAYLNAILPQNSGVAETTSTEIAALPAAPKEGGAFFKTFELGWNVIWGGVKRNTGEIGDSLKNSWSKFKDKINRTNDLNLEKPAVSSTLPLP